MIVNVDEKLKNEKINENRELVSQVIYRSARFVKEASVLNILQSLVW